MENVHVLVIPYPAQGHVIARLEVARYLTINGLKVTFVNTETVHKLIMSVWSQKDDLNDLMQMVSIPDGMGPLDDMNNLEKLSETMSRIILEPIYKWANKLEALIDAINRSQGEKITCIIADYCMGWVSKVAQKMCIRLATFCSGPAALMALIKSVQKLLDDQVIDNNGVPLKDQMTQLSSIMPSMKPAHFVWACLGDSATNKIIFNITIRESKEAAEVAGRIICNSTIELEPGAFALFPNVLPIGPLLATNSRKEQVGHFWNEDSTCLTWLDQQPVSSVIYVAFGSFIIFNQTQFEELALGLELTNRSFLWVTRPSRSGSKDHVYPSGYTERVGTRGKIVSWAPQQEVLNHTLVACFMSHCGWNSTMEGVSNGVPLLCWPYFADQFLNTTYVCDIWKTNLGLNKDDTGIVTREEIKSKVEQLLSNNIVKQSALHLQEKVVNSVREGNSSNENLLNFIDWIKEGKDNAPDNGNLQSYS